MPTMTKFYFKQIDNFIEARLNTDVSVNAWSGGVKFGAPGKDLKIITSDSVTTIWQTLPHLEGEELIFTGGEPNGFIGDGLLFKLLVVPGKYDFSFDPMTSAYLNDGAGTKTDVVFESLKFSLAQESASPPYLDREPPEHFSPSSYQKEGLFDGKPVLIFEAKDAVSGINHYEVREFTDRGETAWQRAESPYLLNDDVEKLKIKAVDNFGNERIETFSVHGTGFFLGKSLMFLGLVIILGLISYNISRWRKRFH